MTLFKKKLIIYDLYDKKTGDFKGHMVKTKSGLKIKSYDLSFLEYFVETH